MIIREEDLFVLESEEEGKIISKSTLLIPFSNLNLTAYVSNEEKLSPIEDAVLRLYGIDVEKFNINRASNLLAVPTDDIQNSYLNLLQKEYIDYLTKGLTDDGRKYIFNRKINNRVKKDFNLVVNKITGELSYQEEASYIRFKDKQKSYFNSIYEDEQFYDVDLSLEKIRPIWKYRKNMGDNRYKGELLEVLTAEEKGTVYRKFNIYYFLNKQNNVEIRAYYRTERNRILEQFILEKESANSLITSNKYDYFFETNVLVNKKNYSESYDEINSNNKTFKSYTFLSDVKEKVDIFFPLTQFLMLDEDLSDFIEMLCESKKTINIFVSGIEEVDNRQKSSITKLKKLSKKYKKLNMYSSNKYSPQTFIIDDVYGLYFSPTVVPISLSATSSKAVLLNQEELTSKQIAYLKNEIIEKSCKKLDIPEDFNLKATSSKIFNLMEEVDSLFSTIGFNWFERGNRADIEELFLGIEPTNDEAAFESFTTKLCIKIVENFKKTTSKIKNKRYFDNDFKREYPDLSEALNRIRVYRNSYSHDEFNKFIAEISYEIIPSDFDNYCSVTLENVFEYKQFKMINGLYLALKATKKKLKVNEDNPF
ncbi:hypothetical protein [Enterococcus lemanii]|uniref:Apea-like HEPN domain-containing protein n=1 Tax=Enterococcus lemanii TaxID=1159752 RepID=A0ABV9MW47_9ENTE|nr:hypothetical protein [Enterococcus lemanii]MBM7709258.1 hypothetical protein [Enterococcus lemanii]